MWLYYTICGYITEDIFHHLRDCTTAYGVCRRLVPSSEHEAFFGLPLRAWLMENLDVQLKSPFFLVGFATALWCLWTLRCKKIFDSNDEFMDEFGILQNILLTAKEILADFGPLSTREASTTHISSVPRLMVVHLSWIQMEQKEVTQGYRAQEVLFGMLMGSGSWRSLLTPLSAPTWWLNSMGLELGLLSHGKEVFVWLSVKWTPSWLYSF